MYKLLCADMRRLFSYKLWWLLSFMVAVFCEVLFCIVILWVAKWQNVEKAYADVILTLYPSIAAFFLSAFVGIYVGTEFQEGTLRNKVITGAKRYHIYGAVTVVMMFMAAALQLITTGLSLLFGNIMLSGFYMNSQQIFHTTMVYTGASAAIATIFTMIVFIVGNSKVSVAICIMVAAASKFICTEVISKLYPVTGECTLSGVHRAIYSFFDRYIPFSYLNGGVRYEWGSYVAGVMATVLILSAIGMAIFQKKDMV